MTLCLRQVRLRYRDAASPLIAGLSVDVAPGRIVTLVGPSGAGKSTLLDFIGGHSGPELEASGAVLLNGADLAGVPAHRRRIGLMFQDAVLFPHLSVADNLCFGLKGAVQGKAERTLSVGRALESIDLAGLGPRDPATLSGGQRARVALLRTLLAEPLALLLDEPFASLDPDLRVEMRSLVFAAVRQRNIPALLVTHDSQDAAEAGGAVISLV